MTSISYWNNFYSGKVDADITGPSNFAEFVLKHSGVGAQLVEFGCGNGRDFRFLAPHAARAFGLDLSVKAINLCRQFDPTGIYLVGSAEELLKESAARFSVSAPIMVYSRFVLHAIDNAELGEFFNALFRIRGSAIQVAFEYRVKLDAKKEKVWGGHVRYFVDHELVVQRLRSEGFSIDFEAQGTGLAPYKMEDPVVGRVLASKISR